MNITIGDIMRLSNNVASIVEILPMLKTKDIGAHISRCDPSSLVEFRKQLADMTNEQLYSLNDAMRSVQWDIKRLEEYRVM